MKRMLCLALALSLAWVGASAERRISVDEYRDRMKAGWLGQIAGVAWGWPTEFRFCHKIIPDDKLGPWKPEFLNGAFDQDDLYVEMTFLELLEKYGLGVSQRRCGIAFANSQYRLWHANARGRDALRRGIAPPDSGHPQFNACANDIDYQIESDFSGLVAPGCLNQVVALGEKFGRIMNYGDGLYAGQFVGAMYAAAFFETNRVKVVEKALACIPSGCRYAEMVRDCLAWHAEDPKDWEKGWAKIETKYGHLGGCTDMPDVIEAILNGAQVLLGFLWGDGDPERTIRIACRGGYDSDCNPSTAGGVLFTMIGEKRLPEKFKCGIDETKKFEFTDYTFPRLLAASEKVAREVVVAEGGRIERDASGAEWFVVPERPVKPSSFVSFAKPGPIAGTRFTDEEMREIRFLPCKEWGGQSEPRPSCSSFGYRVVRGRVGDALDRTIANQLAKEDMEYIVAPFATDNERYGLWRTEFWGKYMHSAAPLFVYSGCARLKANMDSSVKAILAAQEPSGYIGNYPDDKRCGAGWDVWGMKYTMMGLIHYYDATGSKEALDAALRLCDYLAGELGPDGRRKRPLAKTGACSGMPSLSNLEPVMWLYNRTKEPRVLKFADYIVAQMDDPKVGPELIRSALAGIEVWRRQNPDREKQDCWKYGGEDRLKAYEMMSCYQGLLEYWQVTGRKDCLDAAVASANSIVRGEVNLAGGSCTCEHWFHGALKQYQPFVHLQETCVTTTWLRLLEKLLEVTGDPKWADEFEKTFFNAYLAACRPDGGEFAMYTPLSGSRWHGQHHCRMHTNCCNENGPRGFVSFLRTAAFAKGDAFYLNQYVSGIAEAALADGRKVGFDVYTLYPAEEGVQIATRAAGKYRLFLRIPAWCKKPSVKLNGKDLEGVKGGYFEINREWRAGDMVVAMFPMDVVAHVLDGHVAFTRGPILLARDSRFDGNVAETISESLADGNVVGGSMLVRPPEDAIAMAVTAPLRLGLHSSNPDGARQSQVMFCDYASAGSEWKPGNYYRTWFELEQRPWE